MLATAGILNFLRKVTGHWNSCLGAFSTCGCALHLVHDFEGSWLHYKKNGLH